MSASAYTKRGQVADVEIGTMIEDGKYFVLIADSGSDAPLLAILLGWTGQAHFQCAGRGFYRIEYSANLDETILHLVDTLIDVRRGHPHYGQLDLELGTDHPSPPLRFEDVP